MRASHRFRIAPWLVALAVGGLVGCGDAGDGPPTGGGGGVVVGSLAVDGGNNQTGPAGGTLDVPLAVRVRQPDGTPARDVAIRFRVVSGSARLLDELGVSDFDGIARGTVILGTAQEASRIVAEVRDDVSRSVTFDVTATAPPVIAALEPSSFGPGDTIRVSGTGFGSNAALAQVLFGGERGTVVPGSASATALRVVVPPCVAAGAVPVTARIANVTTNAATGSASGRSAPLRLALYEAVTLPGATVAACQPLEGNARYALLPSFAATADFAVGSARDSVPSFPFQLGASGGALAQVTAPRPPRTLEPAMALHAFLRWQEGQLASEAATAYRRQRSALPEGVSFSVSLAEVPAIGSTRSFQVLNSITASPSTYSTVTARLVFAGANILVWLDQTAPTPTGVSDQTYVTLGRQFDEDLFPIDARTFGQPTDIDQNGRVNVLFTPVVNRLTADRTTCGSYIAGFFNGIDLVASSTRGNRGEIFYGSVPGAPIGANNCNLGLASWQRTTPATFIHELQHLISYGQHVLRRSGPVEAIWLNEALSHMAEELGGRLYEQRFPSPQDRTSPDQLFPTSAQGFLPPNFSNAYDFLTASTEYSLTSPTEFGTLEERGAGWLFLRWLGDQRGEQIYSQLVQTTRTGAANVEAVAGEPFPRLFADFLTAVALDNFPGADTTRIDRRYQFSSRNLRQIYARLNAIDRTNFPLAYPLDVANLATTAPSKRLVAGSTVAGSAKPGGFDLFELRLTGGASSVTFRPPTGSFQGSLNAQLTVIRIP